MRYPQKHVLNTNDLELTIGMEQTACLEVEVRDGEGRPLPEAIVAVSPNVRYGEWSATILGGDCYNSADRLLNPSAPRFQSWWERAPDFQARTGTSGLAVLLSIPAEVKDFSVEHERFALPIVTTPWGDKRRSAAVVLTPGQTNRMTIRLEPRDQTELGHY